MAYSLRDIIKQRAGEAASSGIQPTIYKLKKDGEWISSNKIITIGVSVDGENSLPVKTFIKQVGTNVTHVNFINVENGIIPHDIFKYAINVEDFSYCFNNYKEISEIPIGLFDNCRKVVTFNNVFSMTNIELIPDDLFKNCHEVKDMSYVFKNCRNLKSIPEDLFANCPKIETFEQTFSGSPVQSIPAKLFKNNEVAKNFAGTFLYTGVESIPEDLFANCPLAENVNITFVLCGKLKEIPENLFANNKLVKHPHWAFDRQ